jgi:hypothetical protein
MKLKFNIRYFIAFVALTFIAIGTISGSIQSYIKFSGIANEMAFFTISCIGAVMCFACSFNFKK